MALNDIIIFELAHLINENIGYDIQPAGGFVIQKDEDKLVTEAIWNAWDWDTKIAGKPSWGDISSWREQSLQSINMDELAAIRDNEDLPLGERKKAFKELSEIYHHDVNLLKQVLIAHLEAFSYERIAWIKGVHTPLGHHLPAACGDMREALESITALTFGGCERIAAAIKEDGVRAAYVAAEQSINSVFPSGVPVFTNAADTKVENTGGQIAIATKQSTPYTIYVKHANAGTPGIIYPRVTHQAGGIWDWNQTIEEDKDLNFTGIKIVFTPASTPGETSSFKIDARNICGPANPITVSFTNA